MFTHRIYFCIGLTLILPQIRIKIESLCTLIKKHTVSKNKAVVYNFIFHLSVFYEHNLFQIIFTRDKNKTYNSIKWKSDS